MKYVLFAVFLAVSIGNNAVLNANPASQDMTQVGTSEEISIPGLYLDAWKIFLESNLIDGLGAPESLAEAMRDHFSNLERAYENGKIRLMANSLKSLIHDIELLSREVDDPTDLCGFAIATLSPVLESLNALL